MKVTWKPASKQRLVERANSPGDDIVHALGVDHDSLLEHASERQERSASPSSEMASHLCLHHI